MIFKREWVGQLIEAGRCWDCRPVFRRNGQPMAYKVGSVQPIQPGRFRPHVGHARIESMEPATAGDLRATEDAWELPKDWADGLEVQVMVLAWEGRRECCAAFP